MATNTNFNDYKTQSYKNDQKRYTGLQNKSQINRPVLPNSNLAPRLDRMEQQAPGQMLSKITSMMPWVSKSAIEDRFKEQ